MNCLPCFQSWRNNASNGRKEGGSPNATAASEWRRRRAAANDDKHDLRIDAKAFTFRELASATKNFRPECLLGEGGFGRVYKGFLQPINQIVAIKQLDKHGHDGSRDFLIEVSSVSLLRHPNLVKLMGYCADGDQRLLVYEYMSGGSLERHLFDLKPGQKPLDWCTRMKIAHGAAQGLEYLHEQAKPPVIYRDLKGSNILLDDNLNPKLSDFDMEKFGPTRGDRMPLSSRVMGTYGYCAPEYARGEGLTVKSDVYSFGVVLLEVITGRRTVDTTRPVEEQNLVAWAQPIFKDPTRFPDIADPLLCKRLSENALNQAVAIAAMCLQEEPTARPLISDIVTALGFLSTSAEDNIPELHPIFSLSRGEEHQESGSKIANSTHHESSGSNSSVEDVARNSAQNGIELGLSCIENPTREREESHRNRNVYQRMMTREMRSVSFIGRHEREDDSIGSPKVVGSLSEKEYKDNNSDDDKILRIKSYAQLSRRKSQAGHIYRGRSVRYDSWSSFNSLSHNGSTNMDDERTYWDQNSYNEQADRADMSSGSNDESKNILAKISLSECSNDRSGWLSQREIGFA